MKRALLVGVAVAVCATVVAGEGRRRGGTAQAAPWVFTASGDGRNCGDIVMPAIAEAAKANHAAFFWHLGDFRKSSAPDEDIQHQPEHLDSPLSTPNYNAIEWRDFIASQVASFGPVPVFLGIGNHELSGTMTRVGFLKTFAKWLDTPVLHAQRLKDDPGNTAVTGYYHWIERGVAFYFLDNASSDELDGPELAWFERTLAQDSTSDAIVTLVVGMHKPLPDGYNAVHSMNESLRSTETGRLVYGDLLKAQNVAHKRVYVLASHQHFFMPDAYDTPYWREHGGVLKGWVVGTAGAVRYALPDPSPAGAVTNVYGSLLATVAPDGEIAFDFLPVTEPDVPVPVVSRYGQDFVHWCFANNTNVK